MNGWCTLGQVTAAALYARALVALARLVLANPHTLVLDEATSLLDPRSARRLEQSLSAVLDGRTVIAIAHRLHTAHDADRVIVMEQGQISESGSHRGSSTPADRTPPSADRGTASRLRIGLCTTLWTIPLLPQLTVDKHGMLCG